MFDAIVSRSEAGASITVKGDLDFATVPHLELARDRALAEHPGELTIDLREVAFVDSSGLKLLIDSYTASLREGWTLRLIRPTPSAMTVFRISGADQHLPFEDAVQSDTIETT